MMRYTTQFLLSAMAAAQFPAPDAPEIAFLGRSNVGKSSLLNTLVGEKAAKVSQTPGRTRAINFFALLDQSQRAETDLCRPAGLWLREDFEVDFGGLAGVHRAVSGDALDAKLCVCLVDSNVPAQQSDRQLIDWLRAAGREFVVVATKIDRLSGNERTRNLLALKKGLELDEILPVSAKTGYGVKELWARIEAAGGGSERSRALSSEFRSGERRMCNTTRVLRDLSAIWISTNAPDLGAIHAAQGRLSSCISLATQHATPCASRPR